MGKQFGRISIRLTENDLMRLNELSETLGITKSRIMRTFIELFAGYFYNSEGFIDKAKIEEYEREKRRFKR